ncbi:tRNA 2'-phosphotransferase 1 [Mortierella sp. AM989]|nr:tRNA 2'-phosphotransferase 1 [Mortierella sp. AM989]
MSSQASASSGGSRKQPSASGSNNKNNNRNRGPRSDSPAVRLSKALSWLLRHNAESQGIAIRPDGYVKIQDVLRHPKFKGYTLEDIVQATDTSDKKRFQILEDENGNKEYIRAVQGHSIAKVAELGFDEITDSTQIPVAVHGTMYSKWSLISSQGLSKMNRNHIHLAVGLPGANEVISGMRNACNLYIYVDTAKAIQDGIKFYKTTNNVILSDGKNGDGIIPPEYFERVAHRYANAAEEYREQNQWEEAVDMHFKAADQFLLATKDAQNQEVIRTLKLMNANHIRQGKDLQRRIAKIVAAETAAAAAAAAAAQPQQRQQTGMRSKQDGSSHSNSSTALNSTFKGGAGSGGANVVGRRRSSSGHQQANSGGLGQRQVNFLFQQNHGDLDDQPGSKGEVGPDGSYLGGSSGASSNSSSAMIEESFTLIKNHVKDDSDPFNKFWDAVENLVLKISSPVAFTSIPLDGDDPITTEDPPALNAIDMPFAIQEGGQVATDNNALKAPSTVSDGNAQQHRQSRSRVDPSYMQESFFIIDSPSASNSQLKGHSRGRSIPTSDSASISSTSASNSTGPSRPSSIKRSETIASTAAPRTTKTLEEYAIENQQLKMTLDKLSKRNLKLERNAAEGVMQMSIWTKDVQRSAMQLIKSQDVLRPMKQSIQDLSGDKGSPLSHRIQAAATQLPSTPSASLIGLNPSTMQIRMQELEAEVMQLKQENSKLNSLMKKYKQRWEDLKESAKKRRNAASAQPDSVSEEDNRQALQRPLLHGASTAGANPYSSSSLVGNPNSQSLSSSNATSNNGSTRPLSSQPRSLSAPGPLSPAGGGYQRRILMENVTGGIGLDSTPLNIHRQSSGIVSSTSPRVLDSSSPRSNLSGLAALPEMQRTSTASPATQPFSITSPSTMNAHIVTASGKSPQLGAHPTLSPRVFNPTSNLNSPKLSSPGPDDLSSGHSNPTEAASSNSA